MVGNRDLDWRDRVGADARAYVLGLSPVEQTPDFLAAHGDRRLERDLCTDDIGRGLTRSYQRLALAGVRVGMFGHSHRARIWRLPGPDAAPVLLYDAANDPSPCVVDIAADDPRSRHVINVGTTGLPFPGKGPASCAVYDVVAARVEIVPLTEGLV